MTIRTYQIGGCVRDEIIGVPCKDIDYSVEAPSFEAMREFIIENGGEIFLESPEFVTIRARFGRETADYVLCRKDGTYSDGRRPDFVEMGNLFDDQSRRDFTMNSIAKDDAGNYIDPFNGIADIEAGIIRCVGNAQNRMREDYLRMMRAVRFSITKRMRISADIMEMFDDAQMVENFRTSVSRERVREEVAKMFKADTIASINFFAQHPIFAQAVFGSDIWMIPTNQHR